MGEYDKVCIETFLKDQLKLFPEKGMSKEELEQADEVFKLPDGRYLVVDA